MAIEIALPVTGGHPAAGVDFEEDIEFEVEGEERGEIDEEAMEAAMAAQDHNANLAEHMSEDALMKLAKDLCKSIRDDKTSRREWEEILEKGLELLGTKYQESGDLFEGASGVVHPLLSKAVVQFQAQAYGELFPSGGPVRTQVAGDASTSIIQQANRVRKYMNYQITTVIEEYEEEYDNLLFKLPLDGSAFKKTYFDDILGRPASRFVAAKDLIVPHATVDINTAPRFTHAVPIKENRMKQMMDSGFYREVDLGEPSQNEQSQLEDKQDDVMGVQPNSQDRDEYTVFEVHVVTELEGFEEESAGIGVPYIVSIEEESEQVLSIRRNWNEDDESKKRKDYFSHYKFLPGLGFYGFGLTHMIGNLSITATALLRMLIDAGVFANLPGGFKAKGMRIRGDNEPIKPGEFRDVDIPSGNLREGIIPLPFKEPSATLLQLLSMVIEAGNDFAATTNEKIADSNQQAPVGTTVALIEQGMKVMSGVHKRCHRALKSEIRILARIIKENYTEYPYDVQGQNRGILAEDFDADVDILPVSDPNIHSQTQRISMAQTQLQIVMSAPELHGRKGQHEAIRRMYFALGVSDVESILPALEEPTPKDPATEASEALTGEAMQAFKGQDHAIHVETHVSTMSLPSMINPVVQLAFESHIFEHIAMRAEEEVEGEVIKQRQLVDQMSPEIQDKAAVELNKTSEKAVTEKVSEYLKEYAKMRTESKPAEEDPLVTLRKQEIALEGEKLRQSAKKDSDRLAFDRERGQASDVLGFKNAETSRRSTDQRTKVANRRISSGEEQTEDRIMSSEKIARMRSDGDG